MPKLRVLIVDDAVVVRKILTDAMSADPELEVFTAANGRIALQKIPQVNPDVVTLDVEMPEMDGLTTLKEIRKVYQRLPVIMFSTLTERGGATTLDALAAGASDYATKPANVGHVSEAMLRVRTELIPKIKALCGRGDHVANPSASPSGAGPTAPTAPARVKPPIAPAVRPGVPVPIEVVAIGVSTGGPNALSALLPAIPKDLPVPIVIVQHMPPVFTRLLAERLAAQSRIGVVEGVAGMALRAGVAIIAPGGEHMVVERAGAGVHVALNNDPPENSCRPAVDVLFRSVAWTYGPRTLAVILTGMGQDGLRGCEYIHEAGGQIVVQDEASSVVWGMPGFVAKAGLAGRVLPLSQIAQEITRRVGEGRRPGTVARAG